MSPLEEIIYLADFIEENRQGEFFEEIRKYSNESIKKAIAFEAKMVLERLIDKGDKIHPNAFATYKGYKKYLEED